MPRFRLLIEYFGAPYHGWQSQAGGRTVQDAIETMIGRLGEGPVRITCAGRTDAGVHALGQVAHVELTKPWRPDTLRDALNAHLTQNGETVAILAAEPASEGFDARLSAVRRHYRYRILNRRAPSALERQRVWHVARPLDAEAMHNAAQSILGKHDFTTFRAAECQARSPMKTLDVFRVSRSGDSIEVQASARSFLHHQVRSMVGSLKLVGAGKWKPADLRQALEARDRKACGPVAPPDGLYLTRVDYAARSTSST